MNDRIKVIDDYCDMLCKELQKIVESHEINPSALEIGDMIAEIYKDFEKYKMMVYAEEHQDEYRDNYRGNYPERGVYGRMYPYDRYPYYAYDDGNMPYNGSGSSGNYNADREGRGYGYRNYGHENHDNEHLVKELERIMNEMPTEQGREAIRNRISQLKSHN